MSLIDILKFSNVAALLILALFMLDIRDSAMLYGRLNLNTLVWHSVLFWFLTFITVVWITCLAGLLLALAAWVASLY